jgi:hypothetical protein
MMVLKKSGFRLALIAGLLIAAGCSRQAVSPMTDAVKGGPAGNTGDFLQAFPGEPGVVDSGYYMGQKIVYHKINGMNVFQGDIILPDKDISKTPPALSKIDGAYRTDASKKWPNNIVFYDFYEFNTTEFNNLIRGAIVNWEGSTKLRFIYRNGSQPNYLHFTGDMYRTACGGIGMEGGIEWVYVLWYSDIGPMMHEIGHATNLFHEHARNNRDSYVTIKWNNINAGYYDQFQKYADLGYNGVDNGSFDFNSLMLYSSRNSFAIDPNKPTMTKLDGSEFTAQRNGLSSGDIAASLAVYPQPWTYISGATARDIAIGANGSVHIIGTETPQGRIWRWTGSGWSRYNLGAAMKIAVAPDGTPWVVTSSGSIHYWNGSSWIQCPAPPYTSGARDIAIGANGAVHIIGTETPQGRIYKWTGSAWEMYNCGAAMKIAVAPDGTPWVVTSSGSVHYWVGSTWSWIQKNGITASSISIGADGTVAVLGTNAVSGGYRVYLYCADTDAWKQFSDGAATELAVGRAGELWLVNSSGYIFN